MSFTQRRRNVYFKLVIPDSLLLDSDDKLDFYFIIN